MVTFDFLASHPEAWPVTFAAMLYTLLWNGYVFYFICRLFPAKPGKKTLRSALWVTITVLFSVTDNIMIHFLTWFLLLVLRIYSYVILPLLSEGKWTVIASYMFMTSMLHTVCFYLVSSLCPWIRVYGDLNFLSLSMNMLASLWTVVLLHWALRLIKPPITLKRSTSLYLLMVLVFYTFLYSIPAAYGELKLISTPADLSIIIETLVVISILVCGFLWLMKAVKRKGLTTSQRRMKKWEIALKEQENACSESEERLRKLRHDQINLMGSLEWLMQEGETQEALRMIDDLLARESS